MRRGAVHGHSVTVTEKIRWSCAEAKVAKSRNPPYPTSALITDRHSQSTSKQTASALCQMSRTRLEGVVPAATIRDRRGPQRSRACK